MATRQNEQAAQSTTTMVAGGLEAMSSRVQSLAGDYGWWDDAYKAYAAHDADWFETNYGESIQEAEVADLFAIVSPSGAIDYSWTVGDDLKASDVLTPQVIDAIRGLARDLPGDRLAAGQTMIRVGDEPMVVAVARITPFLSDPNIDKATLPLLVVGLKVTDERLGELGRSFLIDDLRFEPETAETERQFGDFPAALDVFDDKIGHYVWTPPTPGYAVLRNVLPPIAIALILFCAVALATAFRARKLAIALTESEKDAVRAARTDSMTGLMNRTGFSELVDSPAIENVSRNGHFAVVYLDINGFKAVNDSIGHHGGDDLVRALAARINSVVPPGGHFARIGGDEFAVALTSPAARDTAAGTASAVVHCLDEPFTVHGFEFHVTAAVGYAVSSGASVTPAEIVRRADIAMYQAKSSAEREAVLYHPTMETGALERKQVEAALRRALEVDELRVFYQPVARAGDLSIVGVEALVRWTSKEFGPVSPGLFIPVAEETGLIHDVGRVVVERACRDMHNWPDLKMSINVSPVQLRDPNFANDLLAIVERHGLETHQFQLELTEGILVSNPTIAKRKLARLKELGFSLSLDDFGTGFSSIGYLRQFPFDVLKVDRSFVRDLGMNATANALIQSLVSLGDAMDLSVIAEGIENEDQLRLLRLVQCEYVQGFLVSRPVPAEEITSLLAKLGDGRRIQIGKTAETRATAGVP